MWGRARTIHRKETMIALRAQREAMHIADPVWYPRQEPPPPLVPQMPQDRWVPPRREIEWVQPPPAEPAPAWILWLFIACLTTITIATLVLLKHFG